MFRKQFTVKNNINVRHSERKALFPEPVNACFNSKQQFSQVKILISTGSTLRLFVLDREPLFFQLSPDSIVFPTVYFFWTNPTQHHFPVLFVHEAVLPKMQSGSDLMIPGILLDHPFSDFAVNAAVAIAVVDDDGSDCKGPVAVGRALYSSIELRQKRSIGQKGKAIEVLHTHGDYLWEFGSRKPIPIIVADIDRSSFPGTEQTEQGPVDEREDCSSSMEKQQENQNDFITSLEEKESNEKGTREMDELLQNTFFSALRWKLGPNGQFPIDAGQFYAAYILRNLPPGKRLEIKRTRYKKFANFLRDVNNDPDGWVVRLKTVKGVDSIEEANFVHPQVRAASELHMCGPMENNEQTGEPILRVQENMYSLTERVMPIFRSAGCRRGDIMDLNKIRAHLLDYAQKQNLIRDNGKSIELDDQLQMIVQYFLPEHFLINKLVQKVAGAMTPTVLVNTWEGKQIVHRNQPRCIDLKIEKRCGNKLVTLVSNLALFGIDVKQLDKEIRGTGTSINASAPACEGPQLMVQGNEVNRIGQILSRFGVPKKYIKGLELGLKEPKKKKK